ncbi:hypothetical protein jhhlp_002084 [Lomentospora prolificans]|uniref:Protein-lysine N-methyltransferase EFM4 n=1 Tax=Lomentospora prolificans TaxID=41688 RepID=A0A2N3ND43_9PEZI|nr:hypothetical protein jhhlp_002084 [Lomentospora prolificans]
MADSQASLPAHLEPSKLGTKEYWDALYSTELSNHASNPSDTGTVWFDDSNAEEKLLEFLPTISPPLSRQTTSFLDLGCGNGSLLFALRRQGWAGPALGVDYSPNSVALARRIEDARRVGEEVVEEEEDKSPEASREPVRFETWDLLRGEPGTVLAGEQADGWDVVLDKGTFDAICLSEESDERGRRICEGYKERVPGLVKRGGGLFIVTSCNWTEEELRAWFVDGTGGQLEECGRVEYRAFTFGGAKGQTISTLCFRRR